MYDYIGFLKVFPDSQDLLVEVQHQRHQGVGQEQGLSAMEPERARRGPKGPFLRVLVYLVMVF